MRLIDVVETLRLMEWEEYKYEYEEHYGFRQAEKFVALQPTVEAIPIEWIRKWAGKMAAETNNCNWNTYTLRMLEGWEKENE